MTTERLYETPLCRLRCDRQGFWLTVGDAEIQGDRARLRRWSRATERYVAGFLRGSEPIATHRLTVDGETYVLTTLQMFDLFTALADAQTEIQAGTVPLPWVGLLGGLGFGLGAALTFACCPALSGNDDNAI
ncbi:MAG: hypothetical protein HC918_10395, partial [Oscillatoriales cyanobacterium SM2_1_8]|nr:hypothetical protein [Oscillatoriales cyanobacterium SM2_1_8]